MNQIHHSDITLRPIAENDIPILYQIYRSTRLEELAPANFSEEELENFLHMQFDFQHKQYMRNYTNPSFDLIIWKNMPIGRLYVDRQTDEIRIIDIAILTDYRKKGIGKELISCLLTESDKKQIKLTLHVEYNNPILPFYEYIGFKKQKDVGVYYFMLREPQGS